MQVLISILFVGFLLGILDYLIGNKLGLGTKFEEGLNSLPSLYISLLGIYFLSVTFVSAQENFLIFLQSKTTFDISILLGSFIGPNMGGFTSAKLVADQTELGMFSGILISSTLGALFSFTLPVMLSRIGQKDYDIISTGIIVGLSTAPLGLIVGGLLLGVSPESLIINLLPVLVFSIILFLLLRFAPRKVSFKLFIWIGKLIRFLGLLGLVLVSAQLVFSGIKIFDPIVIHEFFPMLLIVTVIVCGANVWAELFLRYGKKLILSFAKLLDINEYATMGLFLTTITSLSMFPLFQKMDSKGKYLNIAFCVSAAYTFGGQLSYFVTLLSDKQVFIFIFTKLFSGLLAVLVLDLLCKKNPDFFIIS
jgi:ethanolamine transporter